LRAVWQRLPGRQGLPEGPLPPRLMWVR